MILSNVMSQFYVLIVNLILVDFKWSSTISPSLYKINKNVDIYGPSNPPPLPNNTSYYHQPHPQEFNYASKLLNINTNDKEILKRNWFKYGLINPSQLQAQNNHTQQAPPYNTHNIHQSKQANIQPMVKYHLTQSDIPTPTFLALPNHIKKSDENKNSYRSFSNMHLSVLTSHTDHFQTCGHIGYTNNHTNTNNNNKSHTHPYLHNHSSSSALLSNEYTNNNDNAPALPPAATFLPNLIPYPSVGFFVNKSFILSLNIKLSA
eukprot:180222_1